MKARTTFEDWLEMADHLLASRDPVAVTTAELDALLAENGLRRSGIPFTMWGRRVVEVADWPTP